MTLVRPGFNPTRLFPSSLLKLALSVALAVSLLASAWAVPPSDQKALQVYFVDVEGGQATLFVTPAHQSLLIDTGWPGYDGRDADRIVAAAKRAGISKIDYVLITHFHRDHGGGVPQLTARIPVGTFIDHGVNRETTDAATSEVWDAYQKILATGKFKHIAAKPGDTLPIRGVEAKVVSSDGELISQSLPGAGQENASCKDAEQYPADKTENARSLGTLLTFGKLTSARSGRSDARSGNETDVPGQQTWQDRYLYCFASWIVTERQPGSGSWNHAARGHHGQRREKRVGILPRGTLSASRPILKTFGSCTTPTKAEPRTTWRQNSLPIRTVLMRGTICN